MPYYSYDPDTQRITGQFETDPGGASVFVNIYYVDWARCLHDNGAVRRMTPAEIEAFAQVQAAHTEKTQFISTTLSALNNMTPQEAAAWVNTNVTDLASAKDLLVRLAAVIVFLWQERE